MTRIHIPSSRPRLTIRRGVIAAITMFAVVNVGGGLLRGDAPAPDVPATDAEIEAFLIEQIRDAGYPGASFAIVRDGRVTHSNGIGRADDRGRLVTSATPFVIGSLSKAFTAMAVMQLKEAGRVDLDDPITTYLPDFAVAGGGSERITIRHLLHQTSGIPTGLPSLAGEVTSIRAQVEALRDVELASEPGTAFAYSNANYEVLGLLVERVTGRSFGAYVVDEIFAPLRMDDSHVDLGPARRDGLTDAHRFWFGIPAGGAPLWRPDMLPAGWLVSSADDLGRFAAAQLDGGVLDGTRLLSSSGIDTMHRGVADAVRSAYGMGWFDGQLGETRVVSHSGSTTDMASAIYLAPAQRAGIVVLFNGQSVLYELLHKGEAIAEAAMAKLIGEPAGGTLGALYPAFTVAVVLMIGFRLRSLARAVASSRRGAPAIRPVLGRQWIGVVVAAWGWLVAPAVVLVTTPDVLAAPWAVLVQIDVGQALAAYAVLQLLIGAVTVGPTIAKRAGRLGLSAPRLSVQRGVG